MEYHSCPAHIGSTMVTLAMAVTDTQVHSQHCILMTFSFIRFYNPRNPVAGRIGHQLFGSTQRTALSFEISVTSSAIIERTTRVGLQHWWLNCLVSGPLNGWSWVQIQSVNLALISKN